MRNPLKMILVFTKGPGAGSYIETEFSNAVYLQSIV